ncbi:GAF sensor-containing diguanylate cyclase/phosphodiesterase [Salinisphaera sp. PC39]|uniref:putative bifunctional diguanylate cyclase/phosphodiesterase n=1 Tax=Salinisphaera sp. PC39 TaxID=1304156 RepID=UPI00333F9124
MNNETPGIGGLTDTFVGSLSGSAVLAGVLLLLILAWLAYRRFGGRVDPAPLAAALMRSSSDGALIVDRRGTVRRANPVATRLLQLPAAQLEGVTVAELLGHRFRRDALQQWATTDASGAPRSLRILYPLPPPGGERRLQVTWYALHRRKRLVGHLCLLRDARAASGNGKRDAGDTTLDILTGLPGRGRFLQRLERAVVRMYETSGRFDCSLILLNLDRFKQVNDHLGPALADQVLITIAERLAESASGEYLARLEGDQFGILVEKRGRPRDPLELVNAIKAAVERPISVHANELRLTVSMGVVINATDYRYAADLLRDARIALAQAKRRGLGQHQVFTRQMRAYALKHARIEADLRTALENRELRAVYQPIVDVQAKRVVGFETLIRWRHPEHGEISPGEFIDIAEDSERIVPIGRHIRAVSCERLADWQRSAGDPQLYLSFNLTDHEIRRAELVTELGEYLGHHKLLPESVRIELVERMLLQADSRRALERLVSLGLPLYIDDFGTGYSSFSRLYDTPVHTIKIDRSFVQQMTRSEQAMKVVGAIAGLGHSLGVNMIAEGVEELGELRKMESLGCTQIQGYLFAAPVEAEMVPVLLRDQSWIEKRLRRAERVS